jgi:Pyruvate/2-oxoacid:ferredoxin oxidoreductase delta subunit
MRCVSCDNTLSLSGKAKSMWEIQDDNKIRPHPTLSYIQCSKCKSTHLYDPEKQTVSRKTSDKVMMPRYCKHCKVSYFDPIGRCPFCGNMPGVDD